MVKENKHMKRVLLKLSGEALAGEQKRGFDEATVTEVAKQIKTIVDEGLQVGIVIGGGNFWRGRTSGAMDRSKADQIGMLATIMNCIYVSDICRYVGLKTEVFTPFVCGAFTTLYSKDAVEESFAEGKVVFFAGGTGHPYFSTDTATVLRAVEIGADAILLAKAGLDRMGITEADGYAFRVLSPEEFLPAACQGIIVAEGKRELSSFVGAMTHLETQYIFETERAVLRLLGADCSAPVAAFAEMEGEVIRLRAMYGEGHAEGKAPVAARLQLAAEVVGRLRK